MWTSAGVFRDRDRLERRVGAGSSRPGGASPRRTTLGRRHRAAAWRLLSLLTVGRLIVRAALRREESRGAHSRTDFPARDDLHFQRHIAEVIGS